MKDKKTNTGTTDHRLSGGDPPHHTTFAEESAKIARGLEIAFVELIQFKRENKSPLVVTRRGQVEYVDPFGERLDLKGEAADKERLAHIYELLPPTWSVRRKEEGSWELVDGSRPPIASGELEDILHQVRTRFLQ